MTGTDLDIAVLYGARPRSRFVRSSLWLVFALCAYAWLSGDIAIAEFDFARRSANAARFVHAILPYPIQKLGHWDWTLAIEWANGLLDRGGWQALGTTLAISVAAIVLAGAVGSISAVAAARNIARFDGFADAPAIPSLLAGAMAATWVAVIRGMLIFLRAIPEYVWAFLLIKIFGFTAWPAVLALAIHNVGILGKLGGETIEDIEPQHAEAYAALGASRGQILLVAVMPEVLPRFLLYFFYRWETCVREATVLGMLGIVSLGSLVRDARAANYYDEMLFYVLLASGLVLLGDVVSTGVRATLRRAS